VFFVRVANKGVTSAILVRVASNRVKVPCFDVVRVCLARVARKGVRGAKPAKNGDELMPRELERTSWRDIGSGTGSVPSTTTL
jgi:hypothetical protein